MKPQQLTFILLIALAFQSLRAQQSDPYFTEKETPEYQKLYIHTDRDIYFLGETIWFSAYLLDGQNQVPVVGDQNLIVDLIDTTGNIARSGLYRLADGSSSGGILLTDSIQTGKYVLRAYTNYLRNFGDESFFYKPLSIDRVRSSAVPETASESEILENIEAHFMPEGGFLLENTMNIVAFKITGKGGVEVNTSGYVVDEKGENVAGFQTEYQGMGKFNFYPIPGEKYKAVLDVIPGKYFDLGEIKTAGIKIQNIENIRQDFIRVGIYTNSPEFLNKPYILACMNHGEVIFTEEVVSVQDITEVKILKSLPGGGINRLV
ncbi:MAG: hypothetical protein JXR31_11010, partial [Prolixibacteraceae bacterium]|nr:hypothetical protein [Prolixibacteraceae bacterium]